MITNQIMSQMDEWVSKTGNGRWADPERPDEPTPIQAVREETRLLVEVLLGHSRRNRHHQECGTSYRGCSPKCPMRQFESGEAHDSCLEIGLGEHGGGRYLWKMLFDNVVSIESDLEKIKRVSSQPPFGGTFIGMSSHDPKCVSNARIEAPYDFLYIDGDHLYDGVKQDYLDYAPMVRPGGIVAIHDYLLPDVNRFVHDLERGEVDGKYHDLHRIVRSKHVGVAWEVV